MVCLLSFKLNIFTQRLSVWEISAKISNIKVILLEFKSLAILSKTFSSIQFNNLFSRKLNVWWWKLGDTTGYSPVFAASRRMCLDQSRARNIFNVLWWSLYVTHCFDASSLDPRCACNLVRVQRYFHEGVFLLAQVSHLDPHSVSYWRLLAHALFTLSLADANFLGIPEVGSDSHPSIICWEPRGLFVFCWKGVCWSDLTKSEKRYKVFD